MLDWKISATQDENAWFDDFLRSYIGSDLPHLPPHVAQVGEVEVSWVEPQPGYFTIEASGGSREDRWFADEYVATILAEHGLERQAFVFEPLVKTADYEDVESKARRLIETGKVHILANHPDEIQGTVEGDHGTYEVNIKKQAPNASGEPSEAISGWNCECEWGQFAWGRTRQWKRFEGRPCAHCLALYWAARSVPQEHEQIPEGWTEEPASSPWAQENAPTPQNQYPGAGGMVPPGASPMLMNPPQVPQQGEALNAPGQAPAPPPSLPPFPAAPENMPAVNPVSVPGQKLQSPLNPIQNPGGTFSHVGGPPKKPPHLRDKDKPTPGKNAASDFKLGKSACGNCEMFWKGKCWGYGGYRVREDETCDSWAKETRRTSAEKSPFSEGDMVQLKQEDVGTWVGLNGGGSKRIPANSIGQVEGVHPSSGLVEVYYPGPAAENGQEEPHGVTCWHWSKDLIPRPDIPPYGSAATRRR